MKPTERKAMVDNVSGLNQLDALELFLKETIKTYRDQLDALEGVVLRPVAPTAPAGWTRTELEQELGLLEHTLEEVRQWQGKANLKVNYPQPPLPFQPSALPAKPLPYVVQELPTEPEYHPAPEKPAFPGGEDPEGYSEPAYQQLVAQAKLRAQGVEREARLVAELAELEAVDASKVQQLQQLLRAAERSQEKARLQALGEVDCPSCLHHFPLAHEALVDYADVPDGFTVPFTARDLARFEAQLSQRQKLETELANIQAQLVEFPDVTPTLQQWEKHREAIEKWNLYLMNWEQACAQVKSLNDQARANWKDRCRQVEKANAAGAEQDARNLVVWDKQCSEVVAANAAGEQRYQDARDWYEAGLREAEDQEREVAEAKAQLEALPSVEELQVTLQDLNTALRQWDIHDYAMNQYQQELARYEQHQAEVERMKASLQDHLAAQAGLKAVKVRVKNYLLPSLNRAASYLVNEMTGGERSSVALDDSFEVEVDGQPLRTLSGSGQDITNLAIRLGLGQILTHKVLPLFMVDEHDAGMDWERATHTHKCLTKITPQIGQLLIVSHKELEAQNKITL
jgi:DNA repair exonuclease SbcCD ATPase subunit